MFLYVTLRLLISILIYSYILIFYLIYPVLEKCRFSSDSGDIVKRQSVHNPQTKWPINVPQSEEYYCRETCLVSDFNQQGALKLWMVFLQQKMRLYIIGFCSDEGMFHVTRPYVLLLFFLLPTLSLSSSPLSLLVLLSPHCSSLFPLPHFSSPFLSLSLNVDITSS